MTLFTMTISVCEISTVCRWRQKSHKKTYLHPWKYETQPACMDRYHKREVRKCVFVVCMNSIFRCSQSRQCERDSEENRNPLGFDPELTQAAVGPESASSTLSTHY